jgi:hypothetical protein
MAHIPTNAVRSFVKYSRSLSDRTFPLNSSSTNLTAKALDIRPSLTNRSRGANVLWVGLEQQHSDTPVCSPLSGASAPGFVLPVTRGRDYFFNTKARVRANGSSSVVSSLSPSVLKHAENDSVDLQQSVCPPVHDANHDQWGLPCLSSTVTSLSAS